MGLMSNPNGYIKPDNSNVAVSPSSDLTECHVSSEVEKIGPDQNLVDPQMSSQDYLDNYSGLFGDFTKMQDQNWFENINGMIPNYSDKFWNIGYDEDLWLLQQQQQVLDNGSFWTRVWKEFVINYGGKQIKLLFEEKNGFVQY